MWFDFLKVFAFLSRQQYQQQESYIIEFYHFIINFIINFIITFHHFIIDFYRFMIDFSSVDNIMMIVQTGKAVLGQLGKFAITGSFAMVSNQLFSPTSPLGSI